MNIISIISEELFFRSLACVCVDAYYNKEIFSSTSVSFFWFWCKISQTTVDLVEENNACVLGEDFLKIPHTLY